MKARFKVIGLLCAAAFTQPAMAQWAVFDGANFGQMIKQVTAWKDQFKQMKDQLDNQKAQFDSMNGNRGMANLVNDPALRRYLPNDYQTILNNGYGNSAQVRSTYKRFGIEGTALSTNGETAASFNQNANQAAINRATAEEGYRQASARFASIQVLLDKVNNAPDAKSIADLQARIQAEQVMLQNENIKLQLMAQLVQAQRDLQQQQATEIRMKSSGGEVPRF